MNHCDYFDYWGKGTKVTVTSDSPKGPNFLYVLRPCKSSGSISLGCVAGGFSPVDSVSFSWKGSSGDQLSQYQYSAVDNNGVGMVVSAIHVNATDWGDQDHYTCVARHQSLGRNQYRRIRRPGLMAPPTVSIQTPSPEDINGKSEFFLVCLVTGFYPEEIYIMWQVNDMQYEEGITGEPVGTGDEYSVTSLFMVSEEDWNKGNRYTCNARQTSQETSKIPASKSVSKLTVSPPEKESNIPSVFSCDEGGEEEDEFSSLWSTAFSFIILFLFSLVYSALLSLLKAKQ